MTDLEAYSSINLGYDEPDLMVFLSYDDYLDFCCILGVQPELMYDYYDR